MMAIAERLEQSRTGEILFEKHNEMEAVIWSSGWDGEWFRRAYDDFGRVLGSQENDEGRIFIEPQGVCVMAGLGIKDGRATQALDSVSDTPGNNARDCPATTGVQ